MFFKRKKLFNESNLTVGINYTFKIGHKISFGEKVQSHFCMCLYVSPRTRPYMP